MNVLDLYSKKYQAKKKGNTHGGEWAGTCPACGGNDRFMLWPLENQNKGSYWCRQCEKSGDNIQFLIDFEGKTFKEACAILNIELKKTEGRKVFQPPRETLKALWQPKQPTLPADLWQPKALSFVKYAHEKLLGNHEQLSYLQDRGIDYGLVEKFSLGWNPETFYRPRSAWGLPEELKDDGTPKKLAVPAGIVIPYFKSETLLRIRVRTGCPKIPYYLVPGSSPDPMVIEPLFTSNYSTWIVEESELDGIMLSGIAHNIPGVGIVACGNTSVRPTDDMIPWLRTADRLLIAMDYDGRPGAKAYQWWQEHFDNAERWIVLSGKDPGESYKNGDDLREWIVAGLPALHRLEVREQDKEREMLDVKRETEDVKSKTENDKIKKLHEYLKKYPVKIVNTEVQTQLIFERDWDRKHDAEAREISRLLFSDEGVAFLHNHPAKLIDRRNFLNG